MFPRPVGAAENSLVQQQLTHLDSVGRRCATGLHKLGARYAVPLETIADDNGRVQLCTQSSQENIKRKSIAICNSCNWERRR
jgi:hypothetical protein